MLRNLFIRYYEYCEYLCFSEGNPVLKILINWNVNSINMKKKQQFQINN